MSSPASSDESHIVFTKIDNPEYSEGLEHIDVKSDDDSDETRDEPSSEVEQINAIIKKYVDISFVPIGDAIRIKAKQPDDTSAEQPNDTSAGQKKYTTIVGLLNEQNQEFQVLQETSINWAERYTARAITIDHLIRKLQDIRNSLRRVERIRSQLHADLVGYDLGA